MPLMIKIAIYLSYLFLLSELILMLTKRSKHKFVKRKGDRGSLIILWITISVCLTLGFNLANYTIWSAGDYFTASLGFLLSFTGMILRWTSIIQLKKAFTVDVAINKVHQLKTDGLYKIVRHPSYLGLIMILGGFSLVMNSLPSILVVTVPVSAAILYRISVEERVLNEEFGDVYLDYKKNTRKIIPFIY
jgi:protein-S-isoprenylcysteine O-methyltransferase Ste14